MGNKTSEESKTSSLSSLSSQYVPLSQRQLLLPTTLPPTKLDLLQWPSMEKSETHIDLIGQVLPFENAAIFKNGVIVEVGSFEDGSSSKDDFCKSLGKPPSMVNLWKHDYHLLPCVVKIRCYKTHDMGKLTVHISEICQVAPLPYTPAFDRGGNIEREIGEWSEGTDAKITVIPPTNIQVILSDVMAKHSAWFYPQDIGALFFALSDIIRLRNSELKSPTTINAVIPLTWSVSGIRPELVHGFRLCLYDLGFRGLNRLHVSGRYLSSSSSSSFYSGPKADGWHIKLYDTNVVNVEYHKKHKRVQKRREKPIMSLL